MNAKQFRTTVELCKSYMSTLNLDEVKIELIQKGLLTQNKKLSKGDSLNYGLELLPSTLSGYNTCPNAGVCKLTCIAFTGQGNILHSKKLDNGELTPPLKMKARRTFILLNDREWFDAVLKDEIHSINAKAKHLGKVAHFRLNTTSDIDWVYLTDELSNVQFYDYTKVWSRVSTPNYRLTFSASEVTTDLMIMQKVRGGENVAVVFNDVPESWNGFQVIDGDVNDDRYSDQSGVIVGLKLKTTIGGKTETKLVRG